MGLRELVVDWLAQQDTDIYLVGGCVRDVLLNRAVHDLDLAVAGGGLELARRLADRFSGDYYPLDEARGTGRAILSRRESETLVADVAELRGADLRADLAARDFTINALAANVRDPGTIIDHHGGLADLDRRLIRVVSDHSIADDPVRTLRAVRQSAELGMDLAAETVAAIRRDGRGLQHVSGERLRDELCRLLALPDSAASVSALDRLGLLTRVLPELALLRDLSQPPPHHLTGLDHTLETLRQLERLIRTIPLGTGSDGLPDGEAHSGRPTVGPASPVSAPEGWLQTVEPFASRLLERLHQPLGRMHPRGVTLKLAALLHDTGKPGSISVDQGGRIRFLGHHQAGAAIAAAALRRLRLSNAEVQFAETVVRHHMRPLLLANQASLTARAVYRYFRATSGAGVEVLLHALADHLATRHPQVEDRRWPRLLDLTGRMWADYLNHYQVRVKPPAILSGRDLITALGLAPGPQIGKLLEAVREAQVTGQVSTVEDALRLARALVEDQHAPSRGAAPQSP